MCLLFARVMKFFARRFECREEEAAGDARFDIEALVSSGLAHGASGSVSPTLIFRRPDRMRRSPSGWGKHVHLVYEPPKRVKKASSPGPRKAPAAAK